LPMMQALAKNPPIKPEPEAQTDPADSAQARRISWGRAGGEADAIIPDRSRTTLSADGMDQCIKILEAAENGQLGGIDFLELMACTCGCVGGPLSAENPSIARHALRELELSGGLNADSGICETDIDGAADAAGDAASCIRSTPFPARTSALLLDPDYKKAMRMLEEMETIFEGLPGLDCGCCGSPGCHTLAEDIVRGDAVRTDCVIILKEQYRALLDGAEPATETEQP